VTVCRYILYSFETIIVSGKEHWSRFCFKHFTPLSHDSFINLFLSIVTLEVCKRPIQPAHYYILDSYLRQFNNNNNNPLNYILQNFKHPFPNIKFVYTSTYETAKMIKSLKTKNSCWCDEISVKILQLSTTFISSPLT
jgi:hypothetical protein